MYLNMAADSFWTLRLDIAVAKALVWLLQVGRDRELTPEAHLYFADRYWRLAQHHRTRGHLHRAARLEAIADEHSHAGGWDDPPRAAAMAMPRPRRFIQTDAVSQIRLPPDEAA